MPPFADAFVPPAAGCPAPDALVLPELAGVEELAELPDPPEGGVMPAAARAWAWAWPRAKPENCPWNWVWPEAWLPEPAVSVVLTKLPELPELPNPKGLAAEKLSLFCAEA